MLRKLIAGAFVAAAFATVAQATEVPVKKGAQAAAQAAPDDVICTYEQTLGSHMKRRVCATKSARDEQARADRNAIEKLRTGGSGKSTEPRL